MNINIREYADADYDACRSLWTELTQHHRDIYDDQSIGGDDPGAELDPHLADPKRVATWVAEHDHVVLGFCSLNIGDEGAQIDPIVVRKDDRSKGIGRALLETAIDDTRARKQRSLSIQPVARNADAMRLYRELGFTILGHIDMTLDLSGRTDREWKQGIEIHGKQYRY